MGERSSITKSGHKGKNFRLCSVVKDSHFSIVIQEASGERFAPLGNLKPVEESKALPKLFLRLQPCGFQFLLL